MHKVYQRALVSVALFDSVVEEQSQLDAVAAVWNWGIKDDNLPAYLPLDIIKTNLVDFLEIMANDQWNTRAWILQESLASDDHMVCLLKTKLSIPYMEPADDDVLPYVDFVPESFCITTEDIQRLINISRKLLLPPPLDFSTAAPSMGPEDQRATQVLERIKRSHPVTPFSSGMKIALIQGTNYGTRKTCSAATALTSLRTQLNFRVADRLVIMANICDYEIRLNTTEVETRFKSLTECLFALALMNGDLSLLNSEIYQSLSIQGIIAPNCHRF